MHETKLNRVYRNATWHQGPRTHAAIMAQVPESVISECPSRIIAEVATAINRSYHSGRSSCGSEVVDDCIWIDSVGKLIPLAALRDIEIRTIVQPSTVPGSMDRITNYQMDYTERF